MFCKKFLFSVFELPSPRNTQNTIKQNRGKPDIKISADFFGKFFRHGLFAPKKCGVFELTLPSNAQNRSKEKY
jgi:hypothetical protein